MPELPIQANGRSARANRPFARANRRVAHANRQVAHANRPVANENRPVANENRPVANENRPVANENRPVANENRPVANEKRPVANKNRPVASENRPVANGNRPVANENRRCARATWRLGMLLTYSVSTLSAAQVLAQPSFRGTDHARSVAGPCRPVLRRSPFRRHPPRLTPSAGRATLRSLPWLSDAVSTFSNSSSDVVGTAVLHSASHCHT